MGCYQRFKRKKSHRLYKTIHHALLAGPVERNGELVAVHQHDIAVAEFLVKHAVADRELRDGAGRFGDHPLACAPLRSGTADRALSEPTLELCPNWIYLIR